MSIARPPITGNAELDRWASSLYDEVNALSLGSNQDGSAASGPASGNSNLSRLTGNTTGLNLASGGSGSGVGGSQFTVVNVTPPTPSGVRAFGGISGVMVTWDVSEEAIHRRAFLRAEVFRNTENTLGSLLDRPPYGETGSNIFVDSAVDTPETYYYWVRLIYVGSKVGPISSPAAEATTAVNVEDVLSRIEGRITGSHLNRILNQSNVSIFRQDEAPTEKLDGRVLSFGDVWYDTNDGDLERMFTGDDWEPLATATQAYVAEQITTRTGFCQLTEDNVTTVADAHETLAACNAANSASPATQEYEWIADGVIAAHEQIVAAALNTESASIREESEVRFNAVGNDLESIRATHSVVIDNNGHVSGFALISDVEGDIDNPDGSTTARSSFVINADEFIVTAPGDLADYTDPNDPDRMASPFIYISKGVCVFPEHDASGRTTGYTVRDDVLEHECRPIGGEWNGPGLYLRDVYIGNGTITTAHLGNATMDAAQILGKLTAAQIDTGGLYAKEVMVQVVIDSPRMVSAVIHGDDIGWSCMSTTGAVLGGYATPDACAQDGHRVVWGDYMGSSFIIDANAVAADRTGVPHRGLMKSGYMETEFLDVGIIQTGVIHYETYTRVVDGAPLYAYDGSLGAVGGSYSSYELSAALSDSPRGTTYRVTAISPALRYAPGYHVLDEYNRFSSTTLSISLSHQSPTFNTAMYFIPPFTEVDYIKVVLYVYAQTGAEIYHEELANWGGPGDKGNTWWVNSYAGRTTQDRGLSLTVVNTPYCCPSQSECYGEDCYDAHFRISGSVNHLLRSSAIDYQGKLSFKICVDMSRDNNNQFFTSAGNNYQSATSFTIS
jgi:hypothetical protein